MDPYDDSFVLFGAPIKRVDDVAIHQKKALTEASATLPTLPPWNRKVWDDEGTRRFNGEFTTGEYSAEYFNTVGSKEGWAPQTFMSSRKNRADFKQQRVMDFLDEDEKAEMDGKSLEISTKYDTFGFTAAEIARKQAETDQKQRPTTIPGPVLEEFVVSVTDVLKRASKAYLAVSAGDANISEIPDTSEAPSNKDFLCPQRTPVSNFESYEVLSENNSTEGVEVENIERPVDLYKAIFSDDSDDEEETPLPGPVKDDPQKMSEVVNTTLSRLTAADFLESLGNELGLEVPPDMPQSTSKPSIVASYRGGVVDVRKASTISDVVNLRPNSPVTVVPADMLKYESHGYQHGYLKTDADVSAHNLKRIDSFSDKERSRKHHKRHRHSSSSDSGS